MILSLAILTQYQCVTDRQMDREKHDDSIYCNGIVLHSKNDAKRSRSHDYEQEARRMQRDHAMCHKDEKSLISQNLNRSHHDRDHTHLEETVSF